jgi:Mn-containing catalase
MEGTMFLHNKRMQYTVRVDEPNPNFAKLMLDQFGGPNGELSAAMNYFTQGMGESDVRRRDMLLDIATEELSHLEMVAQSIAMLLKGTPASRIDEMGRDYLGELLEGKRDKYIELGLNSGPMNSSGGGPRLTDSMGVPWSATFVDTIGHPSADLRSDIAAEARAKITYERLIKQTDDAGLRDTLTFLMTREIAHQKMFEAALEAIEGNFPPGNLPGDERFTHVYFKDSHNGVQAADAPGAELVNAHTDWGFNIVDESASHGEEPEMPQAKPSVRSTV